MEFLFGSPEPTVRYMDKGSGEWLPVFRKSLPEYDVRAWAGMEKGIMQFTGRVLDVVPVAPGSDGLSLIEDLVRSCLFSPGPEALENLGPLSHGEGWGTGHRLRLLPVLASTPGDELLHELNAYGPWKPGLDALVRQASR
jgi:hypothetical protein